MELGDSRTIGRYHVGASLGRGGMAEVFEAFDPELRRDVALKLMTSDGRQRHTKRIMREAQAQAQLAHPNVVAIYDVGVADGDVYIAMELVRGKSLREWLAEARRPWREVLAPFLAAAQGLVAAHAAGLVHRDFKPSNVLLTLEGVAKVADFGLAVQSQDTESFTPGDPAAAAELDRRLTQTGYTFGTPLYMAPEQHRARRLDAAADQYAFCASLFEALTGHVPFRSTTMTMLVEEKERGAPQAPARLEVPRRIVAALRRGLHPDPRRRWPSMRALVAALDRNRRSWWLWGLAAGAGAGAIAWSWLHADSTCDGRARLQVAWGEHAQQQLRAAIVSEELPHAEAGWKHLHATLDAYAQSWTEAYDHACEATAGSGPDPSLQCLQARLRRFTALTGALARAGPPALDTIDTTLAELEPAATCLDPAAAEAFAEPDAEWLAIDSLLAEANAALVSSDIEPGREMALEALTRARAAGDRQLEAEATFQIGLADAEQDHHAAALPHLERAYFLADELGHHRLAALAASKIVWVIAQGAISEADPERWQQHALGHLQHIDDLRTQGAVYLSLATLDHQRGEYVRAAERSAKAAAAFTEVHGERHPSVATALNNQGLALVSAGKVHEALELLQKSAALYEETLGKLAPRRSHAVLNIGLCQYEMGRYSEAAATFDEVLEMTRAQPRPQHNIAGRALSNKGLCLLELGDREGALQALTEAREQIVSALGESHSMVPTIDMNIALAHHMLGDFAAAVTSYERARTAQVELLGVDHPMTARTDHNLGTTLNSLGQYAAAAERLRAAKATFENKIGPRSELAAVSGVELARSLVGLGELEEALRSADLAREMLVEISGPESRWVAFAYLYRGMALRELGRIAEARTALDDAERVLDKQKDPDPGLRRDLELEREELPE